MVCLHLQSTYMKQLYRIFSASCSTMSEKDLLICETGGDRQIFAPLRILCFDIETNIPNARTNQFSDPRNDSVIQIGNMVSLYGEKQKPFIRSVFTLGTCESIQGCQVLPFTNEKELLMAWQKFFLEIDPDIVMGYNITQFDIPYLLNRARTLGLAKFSFFGRIQGVPQRLRAGVPHFLTCPGYEGRLLLDIFHHIRERHPGLPGEGAYKLNGVSLHFLGQKKEDISYKQIPALQSGDANTRRHLALYCLKDVYLPLLLLDKLDAFELEVTESQDAHVPFNVMRVWRSLKDVAKRCNGAINHGYVIADKIK
ncbi:hypothetical protein D9619_007145 [Psilocybe cf. subviscida]|uniref:DNA polymerase delta catalytic subunit n=1 Tax=Psilocybe cf. subviscida TaxID=2480587 RepID=A0A8H5EWL1_9AGAR|nr:hypothetical protein D9619_007145 [Psilocybe cf. subviscida]